MGAPISRWYILLATTNPSLVESMNSGAHAADGPVDTSKFLMGAPGNHSASDLVGGLDHLIYTGAPGLQGVVGSSYFDPQAGFGSHSHALSSSHQSLAPSDQDQHHSDPEYVIFGGAPQDHHADVEAAASAGGYYFPSHHTHHQSFHHHHAHDSKTEDLSSSNGGSGFPSQAHSAHGDEFANGLDQESVVVSNSHAAGHSFMNSLSLFDGH